jgi:hypothetical protein
MNEPVEKINQENEPGALITQDALEIIERRNALFNRVMEVAIRATSPSDWINQDGKPYLQGSGAEKVARRFGVQISDVEQVREYLEDDKGRYYLYTTTGKASLSERESIEAVGTASSRDSLFSHGGKKALAEVDIGNIKKKSYTNFLGNAITRLLGIRNLAWSDLEQFGIKQDGKAGVSYDKGASKAEASKRAGIAESKAKMPFWEYNGLIFANVGKHFSKEFLESMKFRPSKKNPETCLMHSYDKEVLKALEEEYEAAEEVLSQATREEGGAE